MEKLLEYESKMLENRKLLNELISEYDKNPECDKELILDKIKFLESENAYINNQLKILKQNIMGVNIKKVPQNKPKKEIKNKKDIEKTLGKAVMAIFASLLIFISLILFATILMPLFGNTVKMIIIYTISIAFIIFGLFKLKDSKNKLYISITGCGLGGLYISLILSNLYFKTINNITLYILILVWIFFINYLSRLKNLAFAIIQQLGIYISVILGCIQVYNQQDINIFLVLIIFFMITSAISYLTNIKIKNNYLVLCNIFQNLNFLNIFLLLYFYGGANIMFYIISIIFIIYMLIISSITYFIKIENIFVGITNVINYLFIILTLYKFNNHNLITAFLFLIIFIINDFLKNKIDKKSFLIQQIAIPIFIIFAIDNYLLLLFIISIMLLNYFKNNDNIIYIVYNYILLTLSFVFISTLNINNFLIILVIFALYTIIFLLNNYNYNRLFKIITYISFLLLLVARFPDFNIIPLKLISLTIINIYAIKSNFSRNWDNLNEELSTNNLLNIINGIIMIYSLIEMNSNSVISIILTILCAVALFSINTTNLLEKNKIGGFYVGFKFTILLCSILSNINFVTYVISVILIIFSIICIIIGFKFKYKSLRTYGLILSIVSIFKLIMFDISYNSTLGNAVSFFICGILCFIISFIYNKIDKYLDNN